MNHDEIEALAEQPLDESDLQLLREVGRMYAKVDPVPTDLVERVRFALALDEVYDEVARITREPADLLAVRGDAATRALTDTLTFSADHLSAMVTVTRSEGRLRIDGWLAPAGPREVRVRLRLEDGSESTHETMSDESGRFVVEDLPRGLAQLSFHALQGEAPAVVVTPPFEV